MNLLYVLGVGALVVAAVILYRWYRHSVNKDNRERASRMPSPFSTPTIKDGGPAYKRNGEINWNSNEPIRNKGDRLAMLDEALGIKRRCPKCNSRRWTKSFKDGKSFSDMIHCKDCQAVATDDPMLRTQAKDAGLHIYNLADFALPSA